MASCMELFASRRGAELVVKALRSEDAAQQRDENRNTSSVRNVLESAEEVHCFSRIPEIFTA